ncbi:hypothetical protein MSG28_004489 [Choristoneura fumiferana]|uniref:Uncharacterized protein n=1 Tax=Choristoneura fumiferana TaxID=7141 RepID=A0ACC0K6E8_CHOFU|nr:hypothetical protein MSG28_004489 [Choristoneura fumiferana]
MVAVGYNLGRNARMLAAQSIDRVVAQRQLPAKSLLHRALLQELIKKHKPDFVLAEGRLKRVAAKTQDFVQYFKMADSILNLELFESLPASAMGNVDCHAKNPLGEFSVEALVEAVFATKRKNAATCYERSA